MPLEYHGLLCTINKAATAGQIPLLPTGPCFTILLWMKTRTSSQHTGLAAALVFLAMVFYGISFPATRVALQDYQPISLITIRLAISSLLLMGVNIALYRRRGLPRAADLPKFMLVALFQPLLYFLFETYGLQEVSASISSVLVATIPIFSPLFSRFILHERLFLYPVLGAVLSLTGVALLVLFSESTAVETASFTIRGILLLFGAVFSAVLYSIAVKALPTVYSPVTITAVQNTIGLLYFIPLFFLFEAGETLKTVPSRETVISILFLAVFSSSLAFIFLNYGILKLGPVRAIGMTNLIPIVTAIVSFLFFDELFSGLKIAGMVVILSGVVLAQVRRQGKMPPPAQAAGIEHRIDKNNK
jgi:drug/metabolite transporter (DMT)-like permease